MLVTSTNLCEHFNLFIFEGVVPVAKNSAFYLMTFRVQRKVKQMIEAYKGIIFQKKIDSNKKSCQKNYSENN